MLQLDKSRIIQVRKLLDSVHFASILNGKTEQQFTSIPTRRFDQKTKLLFSIFNLHKHLPHREVLQTLGTSATKNLLTLGLLNMKNMSVFSDYSLSTLHGFYVFFHKPLPQKTDTVYFGPDTLRLARALPLNNPVTDALDLCTGSGIQAILLSTIANHVTAVDISPNAVNVAQFNVYLNNLEKKIRVITGDLYKPLPKKRFALIVANPPFIPTPETVTYALAGSGGEDGLKVMDAILERLPQFLATNGQAILLGMTFGDKHEPFLIQRLRPFVKTRKLDTAVLVYEKRGKHYEIIMRSLYIALAGKEPLRVAENEMKRIYAQRDASNLYVYTLHITHGNGMLTLLPMFSVKAKKKITTDTSYQSLYAQMTGQFTAGVFQAALDTYSDLQKLAELFRLKHPQELSFVLGICYAETKQYPQAIVQLQMAAKHWPRDGRIDLLLGKCYQLLQQHANAKRAFKNGLRKAHSS